MTTMIKMRTNKNEFLAELKEQTKIYGEQKRVSLVKGPVKAENKIRSGIITKTRDKATDMIIIKHFKSEVTRADLDKLEGDDKERLNKMITAEIKSNPLKYPPYPDRLEKPKLSPEYKERISELYWEKQGLKSRDVNEWRDLIASLETEYPTTKITVSRYVWFDFCVHYPKNSFEVALDEFLNDERDVIMQPTHDDVSIALWKIGYPAYDAWNRYMEVKEPEEEGDDCLLEAADLALVFA